MCYKRVALDGNGHGGKIINTATGECGIIPSVVGRIGASGLLPDIKRNVKI